MHSTTTENMRWNGSERMQNCVRNGLHHSGKFSFCAIKLTIFSRWSKNKISINTLHFQHRNTITSTKCEKLPFDVCGQGCVIVEGEEECEEEEAESLLEVPEETCDLVPMKTCKLVTKLIPSLKPQEECVSVPNEVCSLVFSQPKKIMVPLKTEWCLDQ